MKYKILIFKRDEYLDTITLLGNENFSLKQIGRFIGDKIGDKVKFR